jgi:hypothetical protein
MATMTPKEKAKELVKLHKQILLRGQFQISGFYIDQIAEECALIAVDEIINSEPRKPSDVDWDEVGATHQYYYEAQIEEAQKFWQEVKQEIEKL